MNTTFDNISKSELVKTLVDNTPVAYIILDDEYRIHYINDNFLKLRKLDPATTIGEKCYNISNGGVRCARCAVAEAMRCGKKAMISRKDILPDKSVRFIDDYAIPLYKDEATGRQFILEIMVNRTKEMLAREERDQAYSEILSILLSLIEAKDEYTATHSQSVKDISMKIADALRFSEEELFELSIASTLHDIGKVRIPNEIINKPDKLTDEEYETIKRHPAISYDMLLGLASFESIRNNVRHHHERPDGRGYPDGLKDSEIPMSAKIIAVADTYDAMTSTRSYRKALSHEIAADEIRRVAGSQLDEKVANVFLEMEALAGQNTNAKVDTVERVLETPNLKPDLRKADAAEFNRMVDEDRMLAGIFDNTPCGYVLMDTERNVLFASKYFLEFMGLAEEEVVGRKCFDASGAGGLPCQPCAIMEAIKSGHVEQMRQEQMTKNGRKIFDMYGMPLPNANGKVERVIEIIIDRTEEVELQRQRVVDFEKLIDMLNGVLDEQYAMDGGEKMSAKIEALRQRLNVLMEKLHI